MFYAKLSFWPFTDLDPQHPFDAAGMDWSVRWVGILALAAGLAFLVFAFRRRGWTELLLAGWMIALLPVLNLLPLTNGGNIGSERFLGLPLVLLVLGIAMLSSPQVSPAMRRAMPMLGGTLAVVLSAAAVANIRVTLPLWQNELSLWAWAYAVHPSSPSIQSNYAGVATRFGQLTLAKTILDGSEAASSNERTKMPIRQVASLKMVKAEYQLRMNDAHEALASLDDALMTGPPPPHQYLISIGMDIQDVETIRVNDASYFYRTIYCDYAMAYLTLSQFSKALDAAQTALLYAPIYPPAWLFKSFALYGLDRWADGEEAYAQARRYYTDEGRQAAQEQRNDVLTQLCGAPTPPESVCAHWQR